MDRRVRGSLLLLRCATLGLIEFTTGAFAHLTGSGLLPSTPVLGGLLLVCMVSSVRLMRRHARWSELVAALVAGQFVVHLTLTATAGHAGEAPPGLGSSELVDHVGEQLPTMLAHLCGAALVGSWLAWGERAFWTFVVLLSSALVSPLNRLALPILGRRTTSVALGGAPEPHDTTRILARAVLRRGPPALLAG